MMPANFQSPELGMSPPVDPQLPEQRAEQIENEVWAILNVEMYFTPIYTYIFDTRYFSTLNVVMYFTPIYTYIFDTRYFSTFKL